MPQAPEKFHNHPDPGGVTEHSRGSSPETPGRKHHPPLPRSGRRARFRRRTQTVERKRAGRALMSNSFLGDRAGNRRLSHTGRRWMARTGAHKLRLEPNNDLGERPNGCTNHPVATGLGNTPSFSTCCSPVSCSPDLLPLHPRVPVVALLGPVIGGLLVGVGDRADAFEVLHSVLHGDR